MQFKSLALFCDVAQFRSFSRAAEAHSVTQGAVSQSMNALEQQLGVKLLDRSKRPLCLTKAGATYHAGLKRILGEYRALEQEIRCLGTRLQGLVRVATIYSVGASYMPEALATFAQLHPQVEVRIEPGKPARVVEMATSGEADFGLVSYPVSARGLKSTLWLSEPMRLIASPGHPLATEQAVSLAQLHQLPMVGFDTELKVRREIDHYLMQVGVRPRYQMEFDNLDSIIRAIEAIRGIGILPEAAVRREIASGNLRIVACPELLLRRPLGIIRRRSGSLSPAAIEFAEMLLGRSLDPVSKRSG